MYIVIAQNWDAFNFYCQKKGLDPRDRKASIPLITFSDKYRLYGRTLGKVTVAKVGKIDEKTLSAFRHELRKYGVTFT